MADVTLFRRFITHIEQRRRIVVHENRQLNAFFRLGINLEAAERIVPEVVD